MIVKAVLFDFDDTLVVEEASAEAAFLAAGELAREKYGIDPAALHESVRRNARRIWKAAPTHPYCRAIGISSWEGLWARFLGEHRSIEALRGWAPEYRREAWSAALVEYAIDDDSLVERLAEAFPEQRRRRHILFPETKAVLDELKGRFTLGLITNGASDLQREKIEGSGLAHYFHSITISGDIGVGKPDPMIFRAALDAVGSTPDKTVMIGNSLEKDIAAAQRVGIKAIWINREGTTASFNMHTEEHPGSDITPDAETPSLSRLPALIDGLRSDRG